jgi:hypothetical protein
MVELPYPELIYGSFALRPEGFLSRPRVRVVEAKARRGDLDSLPTRVQFGGPIATPLLVKDVQDDADLVAFMRDEKARWQLVHSGVTFRTERHDRRLETANVQLQLSGADVVAWSLLPEAASTPIQTGTSFTFAPKLKLKAVEVSGPSFEGHEEQQGQDPYLRADGLLSAQPAWRFMRTDMVALDGTYRLVMVVRAPVGVTAQLAVTLGGSVRPMLPFRPFKDAVQLRPRSGPTIELRFPEGVD